MTEDELAKEKAVLHAMRDYPLERGQMLFLGPLSVAYIKGDWRKAPWVIPGEKALERKDHEPSRRVYVLRSDAGPHCRRARRLRRRPERQDLRLPGGTLQGALTASTHRVIMGALI